MPDSTLLTESMIWLFELVFAVLEVLHLHPTHVHQGFEAVVQTTDAHTQLFSQLSLGEVWVLLQDAHHPEIGVFLNLGLSACHDVALICKLDLRLETLTQCRCTLNVCIQQARRRLTSVLI